MVARGRRRPDDGRRGRRRSGSDVVGGDDAHLHVARALALVLAQVAHVLNGVHRCAAGRTAPNAAHATPDERLVLATRRCNMQYAIQSQNRMLRTA